MSMREIPTVSSSMLTRHWQRLTNACTVLEQYVFGSACVTMLHVKTQKGQSVWVFVFSSLVIG